MTATSKVNLIVNPNARGLASGSVKLEEIVATLKRYGIDAEIEIKTSGKVLRRLVREAVDRNDNLVIIAGGDGTLEKAAPQLINSSTTLGIIPAGTMNNLANALGIPLELDAACALIAGGRPHNIDLGCVSAEDLEPEYFLESAGIGLSAIAAPVGQALEKGRWGVLLMALRDYIHFRGCELQVEYDDGQVMRSFAEVVSISNAPTLGMRTLIAPDAKMDDGLLDVAVYSDMNVVELGTYFLEASNGRRAGSSKVKFHRGRRVRIDVERPLEASSHMDVLPPRKEWQVTVLPGAVRMFVGEGMAITSSPSAKAGNERA